MEDDGQLALYETVAARLKQAHALVRALDAPESERAAYARRLLAATTVSKHDLAAAARRVEVLVDELRALDRDSETPRHESD
ncbi:hypothetical protein ACFQLX_22635 [Streptomyces polyrhachis]|uniref:Uncharacterized protein n=1 Tax=Streptomyces polyrhachis TaxID=1282885 RepID=A0ABW2GJH1_9ACTN